MRKVSGIRPRINGLSEESLKININKSTLEKTSKVQVEHDI